MRLAYCIATVFAVATPATLARAETPRECAAIPRPSAGETRPFAKSGPYAAGLKALVPGREARASRDLAAAWGKVRAELSKAFASGECKETVIQKALDRRVFVNPPHAVAGEDRYLPPRPVALAVAAGLCASGDPDGAAIWLMDTTGAEDAPARASAAILWAAAGRLDAARALLPPNAKGPHWEAARRAIEFRSSQAADETQSPQLAKPRRSTQ